MRIVIISVIGDGWVFEEVIKKIKYLFEAVLAWEFKEFSFFGGLLCIKYFSYIFRFRMMHIFPLSRLILVHLFFQDCCCIKVDRILITSIRLE